VLCKEKDVKYSRKERRRTIMGGLKTLSIMQYQINAAKVDSRISEESTIILKVLKSQTKKDFRNAVDQLLTEDERNLVETAEGLKLFPQAINIFDDVIRRLAIRFAELMDWPTSALADVIEPRKKVGTKHHYVTLNLQSRNLKGHVVFRIASLETVVSRIPVSALRALDETKQYWQRVVYLEPVFHEGRAIHSFSELKRLVCRPKDPIIAAYLGGGPLNYGYQIPYSLTKSLATRKRSKSSYSLVFLIAHWD
jgi:hypothetical protein